MIYVALGGALGALCRYYLGFLSPHSSFPISTFCINCLGCFCIGVITSFYNKEYISESLNLFLKTGFCGGFTTFSTFSLESFQLIQEGQYLLSSFYIIISLLGGLLGLYLGILVSKH